MISFKDIELQDKELILPIHRTVRDGIVTSHSPTYAAGVFYTIQSLPSWTASSC